MTKFPISAELINKAIRGRINTALAAGGHDLDWLAGEVGVSTHRLLADMTEGLGPILLWDLAEALGVRPEFLATGER